jgi:hypothetical protein
LALASGKDTWIEAYITSIALVAGSFHLFYWFAVAMVKEGTSDANPRRQLRLVAQAAVAGGIIAVGALFLLLDQVH